MLEDTRVSQPAEYDAIAEAYQNSKRLPFREYVERYTLFDMLGDMSRQGSAGRCLWRGILHASDQTGRGRGGHGRRYLRGDDSTGGRRRASDIPWAAAICTGTWRSLSRPNPLTWSWPCIC